MRRLSLLAVLPITAAFLIAPVGPVGAKPVPVTPTTVTVDIPAVKVTSTVRSATSATAERPAKALAAEVTRSGVEFDVAGVTFTGPAPAGLAVEARTHTGAGWSGWKPLEVDTDEGPDAHSTEGQRAHQGTEPLVAAGSDGIQVRVLTDGGTTPRDLRASLVDGGTSPADSTLASAGSGAAAAAVPMPTIITRAQWGADESMRPCNPDPLTGYQAAIVHHTVDANTYTADQAAGVVRGIYAYHTQTLLWCDIGYQFLVDRFGRVYEGRIGSLDGFVLGAQAGGFNSHTFGVSVMGEFTSIPFPDPVVSAVSKVIAWQADKADFDPATTVELTSGGSTLYPAGTVVTLPRVMGHRDVSATECPGATAYPQVPAIRAAAEDAWTIGRYSVAPARYTAVTPKRVLDTRSGLGAPRAIVGVGKTVTLTVPGLPADATSVTLNVTATGATSATWVTAYPSGLPRPTTSNLNVAAGRNVATQVTVGLGPGATLDLYNGTGPTQLLADLVGYSAPTASLNYVPVSPRRVVDSRSKVGVTGMLKAGVPVTVTIPGLPATTKAVTLNVTGLGAPRSTYVTAYPGGATRPTASVLNLGPQDTVANLVTVPVGAGNTVTLYSATSDLHLIADLAGYHTTDPGSRLNVVYPQRAMDTRYGQNIPKAKVLPGNPVTVPVPGVPADATAVVLTLTATRAEGTTYVTAYPAGQAAPNASNLNLLAGMTVANQVVVPVKAGSISLLSGSAPVDLLVDVQGYYAP